MLPNLEDVTAKTVSRNARAQIDAQKRAPCDIQMCFVIFVRPAQCAGVGYRDPVRSTCRGACNPG